MCIERMQKNETFDRCNEGKGTGAKQVCKEAAGKWGEEAYVFLPHLNELLFFLWFLFHINWPILPCKKKIKLLNHDSLTLTPHPQLHPLLPQSLIPSSNLFLTPSLLQYTSSFLHASLPAFPHLLVFPSSSLSSLHRYLIRGQHKWVSFSRVPALARHASRT